MVLLAKQQGCDKKQSNAQSTAISDRHNWYMSSRQHCKQDCKEGHLWCMTHRVSAWLNMRHRQVVPNIEQLIGGGGAAPQCILGGLCIEGLW